MMAALKPQSTDSALRFLLGAQYLQMSDAEQLRALLAGVLGVAADPTGDSIVIDGTKLSVGYEPGGERSLRAEDTCEVCGDPVRSLEILRQYDLAAFLLGRHRETHVHFWLSGE